MYTTTTITSTSSAYAEAFVTKDKKRLKQHDGVVYLKDQDEYEIELFNPTAATILAELSIDGKRLPGGGIVLKPGQRVFLERYLDSPRKFKFSTYEVEEGVKAVENAIAANGQVDVRFYSEKLPTYLTQPLTYTYTTNRLNLYGNLTTTGGISDTLVGTTACNSVSYSTSTTTAGVNLTQSSVARSLKPKTLLKETGLTEKGAHSQQTFKQVDLDFYSTSFWNVSWVIRPESTKRCTAEEAVVAYCSNCGAKRKKQSFKYCPHCGTGF